MEKEKKSIFEKIGEFFFGKPVANEFFGEMTDAGDYYECRRIFKSTGRIVEIRLEKKDDEPDGKQIGFFNWLEDNYDLVINRLSPSIEKEVAEWIPNYRIQNFKKEFILEYLSIPKCDDDIFDWKISFYADNELQHCCSLDMKGLEVKHILIDG